MPTAFVSHSVSPVDRPLLDHVESECREIGFELYLAEREFAPETVTQKIRGAISTSDCVIVLLTESGASSSWVNQEIAIAHEMSKPIIPLLEEGVKAPGLIAERDQIRFTRSSFGESFTRVRRYLHSRTPPPAPSLSTLPDDNDLAIGIAIGFTFAIVLVVMVYAMTRQ